MSSSQSWRYCSQPRARRGLTSPIAPNPLRRDPPVRLSPTAASRSQLTQRASPCVRAAVLAISRLLESSSISQPPSLCQLDANGASWKLPVESIFSLLQCSSAPSTCAPVF
uniref:Uncharacterized protein n=1 Tax=Zea mays TaxID=4577 RepID=A0A804RED6_MAIZE